MEENEQEPTPEGLHAELREEHEETAALAEQAAAEEAAEIEAEAQARSGVRLEEAERWKGVDTSDGAIEEVMTRAVVDIIVKEDFYKDARVGPKATYQARHRPYRPTAPYRALSAFIQATPVPENGPPDSAYHR